MAEVKIDKSKLRDKGNRRLTQSLFVEYQFDVEYAMFTMHNEDREYKGKIYPSLKRLYLQEQDTTEYLFANKYLYDWEQWQRISKNSWCKPYIKLWREELDLLMVGQGLQNVLDLADEGNFQAAKFLADRGWDKKRQLHMLPVQ